MAQVDRVNGLIGTLGCKAPCRVASTTNLTLYGEQTIDGVACVAEDRVLVKDQTTASLNGIWVVSATDWERAPDFDGNRDVVTGTLIPVHSGTTNANTVWSVTTADPITIGTTSLSFGTGVIHGTSAAKATPVDADRIAIFDSANANLFSYVTWANLWTAIKTKLESVQINLGGTTRGTVACTTLNASSTITGNKIVQTQSINDWLLDQVSTFTGSGTQNSAYYNPAVTTNGESAWYQYIYGNNSTPVKFEFGRIQMRIDDKTAGSEDSSFIISHRVNGTYALGAEVGAYFKVPQIYNQTTASAANVNVDSTGNLMRSTSSAKYKTDVEDLDIAYAENLLNLRPIWYRSLCEADNAGWSYYGFLAEEVAEIDPRFVSWGYSGKKRALIEPAHEAVPEARNEHGEIIQEARDARPEVWGLEVDTDSPLIPEGVQYERMVVPLIALVQRQQQQINNLESRLSALDGGND